jgi:hypothetical protein
VVSEDVVTFVRLLLFFGTLARSCTGQSDASAGFSPNLPHTSNRLGIALVSDASILTTYRFEESYRSAEDDALDFTPIISSWARGTLSIHGMMRSVETTSEL